MTVEEKKRLDIAIRQQNLNRHKVALRILHDLELNLKKESVVNGLIASSYYQIGNYSKSSKYFKTTTSLNPNSEIASLGLFHSYIHLGRNKSAFTELDRFLKNHKPKHYKTTLKDLKKNFGNFTAEYQMQIIRKYTRRSKT